MPIDKLWISVCFLFLLCSCSAQKNIVASATNSLLQDKELQSAHTGISVFDPSTGKYLYDYQGDKYFVPASNTKIFTCYAAMKYLKHLLPGIKYYENDTAVYLLPTGDPSLLHPDFINQPVIDFLKQQKKKIYITSLNWKDEPLGSGWSWDDYNTTSMIERNALPVYGNVITWVQEKINSTDAGAERSISVYSDPEVNWKVRFNTDASKEGFDVQREKDQNIFHVTEGKEDYKKQQVPFVVDGIKSALELLGDTTGKDIRVADHFTVPDPHPHTIWSQPVDSLLAPMMHRSDNFFAEQLLLMVSGELLGIMNDEQVIDTLLKTDLRDLPQPPSWVDGSGLSRYNLFTPQDEVAVLNKMQQEFGMPRIKTIFPTGGTGTLEGLYTQDSGYIFAKTGSLTGVLALSGYLYTKKNKLLIFSVMINNHRGHASSIRKSIEQFIIGLRNKY